MLFTSLQSGGFLSRFRFFLGSGFQDASGCGSLFGTQGRMRKGDLDGEKVQTETSSERTYFGLFFDTFSGKECTVSTRHESTGDWTVAHEQ